MSGYLKKEENKQMKTLHLMVTSLCNRDCKHCCNKQYEMPSQVTKEDTEQCDTLCLTGGEPFLYTDPNAIARHFIVRYKNIKNTYVYTSANTFYVWLMRHNVQEACFNLKYINGTNIAIHDKKDLGHLSMMFLMISNMIHCAARYAAYTKPEVRDWFERMLSHNRIYIATNDESFAEDAKKRVEKFIKKHELEDKFEIIVRTMSPEFVPADNCIFRRA